MAKSPWLIPASDKIHSNIVKKKYLEQLSDVFGVFGLHLYDVQAGTIFEEHIQDSLEACVEELVQVNIYPSSPGSDQQVM